MDKIKEQASIVSQLLFSADTGDIYKKTLARTWDILREVGLLLWLVLCLTFVAGEWFYRTAVGLGRSTRAWYVNLSEKDPNTEPQSMTSTGQALFDSVQSSAAYLLAQARQQLGIPEPEPQPSAPPVPSPPVTPPFPTPDEPPTPSGPPAPAEPPTPDELPSPVATVSADIADDDDLA
ncbi:hypothetical protein VB780_02275 [Leptolyngbya sp. CCNP1308]|uniref:hypothetical protein n=1 Tax=Leptolyngbya sp. CCNP1308 TaxID=3110255 RepID=UPI002B1E90B8|nr:hypothetical protein [Leptolyngbya sp. CCNP1308]MEA5447378.1 hypothetical protein [Leptolyngbya sp. CCNP1308]